MPEVQHTRDFDRVRSLPRRPYDAAVAAGYAHKLTQAFRVSGASHPPLHDVQGWSIVEVAVNRGGFLGLPVGAGKTLISFLLPAVLDSLCSLLIVPGRGLCDKTNFEFGKLRREWREPLTPTDVRTWQELTTEGAADFLERMRPDLIMIDEADEASNPDASWVRRIDRYVLAHPEVVVVLLTGTPGRKSIMNYWHLLGWALRERAPIPMSRAEANTWALALDESRGRDGSRFKPGVLGATVELARAWYRTRLAETPGVVIMDGDSCSAPLTIRTRLAREDAVMDDVFTTFMRTMEAPGGEVVTDPLSRWRVDGQLGCGLVLYQYSEAKRTTCREFMSRVRGELRATKIESTTGGGSAPRATRPLGSQPTPNTFAQKNGGGPADLRRTGESIGRVILSAFENGIEQEALLNALSFALRILITSTAGGRVGSTGSPPPSTPPSTRAPGGGASSAGASTTGGSSQSITATAQAWFGGFSATDATSRSEASEIASRVWNALSNTCVDLCRPPDYWRNARRALGAFVRDRIARTAAARSPLDTEAQVMRRYADHPVVKRWVELRDTFVPSSTAIWFSAATVQSAQDWLAEDEAPGIVWTGCVEYAVALSHASRLSYYGAKGRDQHGRALHVADPSRSLIASWNANKKGFNLQPWTRQLLVMPPSSAKWLEQVFGRSHRAGQLDHVTIDFLATSGATLDLFETAIGEAGFARETIGMTQKILRAEIVRAAPHITASNRFRWARGKPAPQRVDVTHLFGDTA